MNQRLDCSRCERTLITIGLLLTLVPCEGWTQPVVAPGLARDSVLVDLVQEGLRSRPEVIGAMATVKADYARVSQAGALPDPVVSLGIQNDGFAGLRIGEMESSWWSVGATQTLPWFGRRGLRSRAATLGARQAETDLERVRLTVQAEVERAYLDVIHARDQLQILRKLEALWAQAEGLARVRYETGEGAQSDILRAQLERGRLQQRRWTLVAEERRRIAVLNGTVGRALDAPLATPLSLGDLSDPALPDSALAESEAAARSPELRRARLAVEQSQALITLARRDVLPDLTISAAVMPRGGEFEPMWQAGLSLSLPIWAGRKQSRAVGESRSRGDAAVREAEAVLRVLRQRLEERRALLGALLESNRLYRSGLLIQSETTVTSTMAQYRVGRVTFASVLEALSGHLADLGGFYESVVASHRIDIAQRELSLDPVAGPAMSPSGSFIPGTGGMGGPPTAPAGAATPAGAGSPSTAMPRM